MQSAQYLYQPTAKQSLQSKEISLTQPHTQKVLTVVVSFHKQKNQDQSNQKLIPIVVTLNLP